VIFSRHIKGYAGSFSYCDNEDLTEAGVPKCFPVQNARLKTAKPDDFNQIPGSPVAYWVSDALKRCFARGQLLEEIASPRLGMTSSDNNRFLRRWYEVSYQKVGLAFPDSTSAKDSKMKWFPYNKGGQYRKWFGNNEFLINWENDGSEAMNFAKDLYGSATKTIRNIPLFFKPSITWSFVSSSNFGVRYCDQGFIFDVGGSSAFPPPNLSMTVIGLLCSKVASGFLKSINQTLNFQAGDIAKIPYLTAELDPVKERIDSNSIKAIALSRADWDASELSWEFQSLNWAKSGVDQLTLSDSWSRLERQSKEVVAEIKKLEEENNRLFINAYELQDELTPEVPESQITLTRADREKDCQRLISYAIGCMMGRYSLDEPGLIYAHAGNVGFDPSRYTRFAADADGILPITDEHWFDDDAPARVRDFLQVVWRPDTLAENMAWLAESLGKKSAKEASETPEETIRRYMADKFYKDHLQTYKKRPIYWLFSSGKQGAFQALVYLHRYNESTLSRMRAEYVIPLTTKLATRLEMLELDANAATSASSASARTKIRKQIEGLRKKQVELLAFDEKLRHHADMRITLELDDGVKVNYGKFGDLLDSVKVVTGGGSDD
jgi:hypothetical protein